MLKQKEIRKKIAVVLTLVMVLAAAAPLAAYAGEEEPELNILEGPAVTTPAAIQFDLLTEEPPVAPIVVDYSDPAQLAAALLGEYTKSFSQCDSSSGSATVTAINDALIGWDTTFKTWTIVKDGSSNYVLLAKEDINQADLGSYLPAVRVMDGNVENGYLMLKDGSGYQIMDAKSFLVAPASNKLAISADCADLPFLNRVLNEAVALAKTYTYIPYSANYIAGYIDSPSALSKIYVEAAGDGRTGGVNHEKLLKAIEELCEGKYAPMNLTIDVDQVAWRLVTNNSNKVTAMYFALIDDAQANEYGDGVWVEAYRYADGELTKGYAPLRQNDMTDKYVDYTDTVIVSHKEFTKKADEAVTYTISYNANVGEDVSVSNMPGSLSELVRGSYKLSGTPERPADANYTYSFGGWTLAADGTEAVSNVTLVDADVEVFAIWTAAAVEKEEPKKEEPPKEDPKEEEPVVEEPVVNTPDDDDDDSDRSNPTINEEPTIINDEEVALGQLPEEITEITEVEIPLAEAPTETMVIPTEEVPLGNVPQTGDSNHTVAWYLLALLSVLGLAALVISGRKAEKTR